MSIAARPMQDGGSDMVETDIESSNSASARNGEQITLSFDNSSGGAWDDRELVNAYDAAMDEFHLHHPGPGSWLDKAVAASRLGQPLPGAQSTSTSWYTATSSTAPVATTAAQAPIPTPTAQPAKRRKKNNGNKNAVAGPSTVNPYTSATNSHQQANGARRKSPAYAPPSPGAEEPEAYDEIEEWYDESYALTANLDAEDHVAQHVPAQRAIEPNGQHTQYGGPGAYGGGGGQVAPAFGIQPTQGISAMEAMGYAMTAQYWAGYWMGVAQAKTTPTPQPQAIPIPAAEEHYRSTNAMGESAFAQEKQDEDTGNEPSNIFITRKQFHKPSINGLRR